MNLRQVLQGIVLVTLPGCFLVPPDDEIEQVGCDETGNVDVRVTHPVDEAIEQARERCENNSASCLDFCRLVFDRVSDRYSARECDVELDDNQSTLDIEYINGGCDVGRRPAGLADARGDVLTTGAWLARAAWLEAASVHAFVRLATELVAHGAPAELVEQAVRFADDEVRHAAIMAALAGKYGAVPPRVQVEPMTTRTLEQIALENAIEGCVRETWGAVVALWQAQTARDPDVRRALAGIAADEIRHASLAWSIDAWMRTQLPADALARIDTARTVAAQRLLAEPMVGDAVLGLPAEPEGRALARRTHRALWS